MSPITNQQQNNMFCRDETPCQRPCCLYMYSKQFIDFAEQARNMLMMTTEEERTTGQNNGRCDQGRHKISMDILPV